MEDMCDAILIGKAPRISLEDSRKNMAVILALLESAKSGKPNMSLCNSFSGIIITPLYSKNWRILWQALHFRI